MILATIQLAAILMTAWHLVMFDVSGCRYRIFVSLLASVWAGVCLSLSVAMILNWPEAIERSSVVYSALAGASWGAAAGCGGNVAQLLRWVRVIRDD